MRRIMRLFVRKDILEKAVTTFMLNKLDVSNKNHLFSPNHVHLDTATKASMSKSGATDTLKLEFKKDCITILSNLITKLQERSPMKYSIVRIQHAFLQSK